LNKDHAECNIFGEFVTREKALVDYFSFYLRISVTLFRQITTAIGLSDYGAELTQNTDLVK
jgi:hypothetical protein